MSGRVLMATIDCQEKYVKPIFHLGLYFVVSCGFLVIFYSLIQQKFLVYFCSQSVIAGEEL